MVLPLTDTLPFNIKLSAFLLEHNPDCAINLFNRMFSSKELKSTDLERLEQIKKSNVKIGNNSIYIEECVDLLTEYGISDIVECLSLIHN